MNATPSSKRLALGALGLAVACATFLLCGCSAPQGAEPSEEAFPHTATAGNVSIGYPSSFYVLDLPERTDRSEGGTPHDYGMYESELTVIQQKDATVDFGLVQLENPNGVSFDEAREQFEAGPENIQAAREESPEHGEAVKDTEFLEPIETIIDGHPALFLVTKLNGMYVVQCYLATDGAIVANVYSDIPESAYLEDPELYDSMFRSIRLA